MQANGVERPTRQRKVPELYDKRGFGPLRERSATMFVLHNHMRVNVDLVDF
jgi:hypothetical protein